MFFILFVFFRSTWSKRAIAVTSCRTSRTKRNKATERDAATRRQFAEAVTGDAAT